VLGKYLILVVQAYLLYFIFFKDINNETKAAYVVGILISAVLFYLFHQAKKVEFDDDYMYISNREKTEVVPLGKVYKIKLTMTSINNSPLWKIGYYDEFGNTKAVRILPKLWSSDFERFKETVSTKNGNVKIKNWSHSFDLDQ
jgi:hypothetical protein